MKANSEYMNIRFIDVLVKHKQVLKQPFEINEL